MQSIIRYIDCNLSWSDRKRTWRFVYENRTVDNISDFPRADNRRSNAEDRCEWKGILFITNTDRKLIGAITDGDIRRWLIKTGNLQEQISRLMNRNPKSVYRREVASAQDVMRRYSITALPVLNSKGIVIDILFEQEQKTEVREGSLSLDKVR